MAAPVPIAPVKWTPPQFRIPADGEEGGIEKLTSYLVEDRKHDRELSGRQDMYAQTDEEVCELMRIAHTTSFRKDEGRYPRFCLHLPINPKHSGTFVCRFDSSKPLTPPMLRRLAAAVPSYPHALQVRAHGGSIFPEGIARLLYPGVVLHEASKLAIGAGAMTVQVTGPGELSVRDFGQDLVLRAGRIYGSLGMNTRTVMSLTGMSHWAEARIENIISQLQSVQEHQLHEQQNVPLSTQTSATLASQASAPSAHATLAQAWEYILQLTIELGHGGTYIILPTDTKPDDTTEFGQMIVSHFDITFPVTDLDLSTIIAQYIISADHSLKVIADDSLTRLLDGIRTLVRLSGIDGCVVLDRCLRVLGFGCKIKPKADVIPSECPHRFKPELYQQLDMSTYGTRHNSARALTSSIPGAIAFVVSQDGHVFAFNNAAFVGPMPVYAHFFYGR